MKKILVFIVILALLYGCAAPSKEVPLEEKQAEAEPKAAENAETQAPAAPAEEVKTEEIPAELNDMLTKSKTKLTSYSYNHKSPQKTEATKIYVKGSKIKIIPTSVVNLDGKFYNTIYLDTESKKAEAYCVGYSNCGNNLGKITDLDYGKAYIETPADWLAKVKTAKKVGEEMVESKSTFKIETNIGMIWVEKYYGFLYQIKDGKTVYSFSDAAFNVVEDSDVNPEAKT